MSSREMHLNLNIYAHNSGTYTISLANTTHTYICINNLKIIKITILIQIAKIKLIKKIDQFNKKKIQKATKHTILKV